MRPFIAPRCTNFFKNLAFLVVLATATPASAEEPADADALVEGEEETKESGAAETPAEDGKKPAGWLVNQHDKVEKRPEIDTTKAQRLNLSGPRFGAFYLAADKDGREAMKSAGLSNPMFMFLGYQFEWAWIATASGTAGLIEIVPVVSGFAHGLFLPSVNTMVGLRTGGGLGFAMGAQAGLGTALVEGLCGYDSCPYELRTKPYVAGVAAIGFAIPAGELLIPIDLIFSFDRASARIGLAAGFAGFL
jgi:hypothetical protein